MSWLPSRLSWTAIVSGAYAREELAEPAANPGPSSRVAWRVLVLRAQRAARSSDRPADEADDRLGQRVVHQRVEAVAGDPLGLDVPDLGNDVRLRD